MPFVTALRYSQEVDQLVQELRDQIREQAFSFHKEIRELLPYPMRKLRPEVQAEHLCQQLLFSVLTQKTRPWLNIQETEEWFRGIFIFLLRELMPQEATFASFMKVYAMEQPVRDRLLEKKLPATAALRKNAAPPVPVKEMECAVISLLLATGKLDKNQNILALRSLKSKLPTV